ncbi:MAG: LUD domain-containing protein [Flavobacteriaceae bacterium]|nr:LUD domain-containing protein [Flavobacteriaceae bacterium]
MKFFNRFLKLIKKPSPEEENISDSENDSSIDENFVQKFIHKGGKFLYCSDVKETETNLIQILQENKWNNVISFEEELNNLLKKIKSAKTDKIINGLPFITSCESLISHDGSIMFSSKQLKDKKLKDLPNSFIVLAKTSQIAKDTREGISGIRNRAKKNSPTIISSIKDFTINKAETDFMTYGNTNTKTLYLLLLEDL